MGKPKKEYSTTYHPLWARSLCRRGLIFTEIAAEFGIGRTTLQRWVKAYPELAEAIEEGKGVADSRVEDSLFRRATGYTYEETKTITTGQGNPKNVQRDKLAFRIEKTTKHVPPETLACIYWLNNRRPDLWRNAPRVEGTETGALDKLYSEIDKVRANAKKK